MLGFSKEFVILDTEFTSWEGSLERMWGGPNEYREIVQFGAISVDGEELKEIDSLVLFIKPVKNPKLSEYFIKLTGITQEELEEKGTDLDTAVQHFKNWLNDRPVYSFGRDSFRIKENCELIGIEFPFDIESFHNLKELFQAHGVNTDGYMSSTIIKAFGKEPTRTGHNALNDVRLILDALGELAKK